MVKLNQFFILFMLLLSLAGHDSLVSESAQDIARMFLQTSAAPLLLSHKRIVNSATFYINDLLALTASNDNTAKMWNALTGELIYVLSNTSKVNDAFFSADGDRIVTVSDKLAKIWDLTGEELFILPHDDWIKSTIDDTARNRVVTVSDSKIKTWDMKTGKLLSARPFNWLINHSALSHDKKRLVTWHVGHHATMVFTAMSERLPLTLPHDSFIKNALFSNDDTKMITISNDSTAKIWDGFTGSLLHVLYHNGPLNKAAFNSYGTLVVTASEDKTAKLWDVATGRLIATFAHNGAVKSASFNNDGNKIITASEDHLGRIFTIAPLLIADYFSNKFLPLKQQALLVELHNNSIKQGFKGFDDFLINASSHEVQDVLETLPQHIQKALRRVYTV